MSVKVRPRRKGGFEVHVRVKLVTGQPYEQKKVLRVSKSVAQRWGEERERYLLLHGAPTPKKEVPTLEEFAPRFLQEYAVANRQKPSVVAAKESILRIHLVPELGDKRLDEIRNDDIQRLKGYLQDRARKTVNNVLTVLSVLLKKAVEWEVIDRTPCTIKLLQVPKASVGCHDPEDYERLVRASQELGTCSELVVLLGGEAGLRLGEITALEWADVDFDTGKLCVQRADWNGHVTAPKGGRVRYVPMTNRLAEALRAQRRREGRVLSDVQGRGISRKMVSDNVRRSANQAGLQRKGVHVLRHTFCSRLAMKGAAARTIQELAGHQDLTTTQRYMHVNRGALDDAIRLLESPVRTTSRGDIVETAMM